MNNKNLTQLKNPEGFYYFPDFISSPDEKTLLNHLTSLSWEEVKMHGIIAKRRVVHYGVIYSYGNRKVKLTIPPPDFLHGLILTISPMLHSNPSEIIEILITEYPPGAGIGWHKDAPLFGDRVVGVSLASACTMKLRLKKGEKYEIVKVELAPCSAYILSGPARLNWQHSIPAVKTLRYSITFRTLR